MMDRRTFIGAVGAALATPPVGAQSATPRPARADAFKVDIPQDRLDDLHARLIRTRFAKTTGGGWTYGADSTWLKATVDHWANGFNWRDQERRINGFPHYLTKIDGRMVHFVYERGSGHDPLPLMLVHGWPYSFHTFLDLVEPLAHPERFGGDAGDGFDVIVPSIPGFAFSEPADDRPRGLRFLSGRLHRLMTERLGYQQYMIQGSDFGAVIGDWLALDHPEAILGLHETMVAFRNTGAEYGSGEIKLPDVTEEERAFAREEGERFKRESAYFMLQATRPGTITPAFADSPAALLAWMGEKYYRWTDRRARAFDKIVPVDRLLTEVSLYWLTDSAATAIWPYAGFAQEPFSIPDGRTITVPVAVMLSPDPLQPPAPRHLAERSRSRLIRWTSLDQGGHFPMLEMPDALIADVRAFARAIRR
jgi:pimeloyl-ACP methyl ester carboxylesterase